MRPINPKRALFIKLGQKGSWEKDCIEGGTLKFGFGQTPFEDALQRNWDKVEEFWIDQRNGDPGTAKRDVNQIKHFFDSDEDTLWITFYGGCLYWCFTRPQVIKNSDGTHTKLTVDGWHKNNIQNDVLTTDRND